MASPIYVVPPANTHAATARGYTDFTLTLLPSVAVYQAINSLLFSHIFKWTNILNMIFTTAGRNVMEKKGGEVWGEKEGKMNKDEEKGGKTRRQAGQERKK